MSIRIANTEDFSDIWPIFNEIVKAGETYAYPQNTSYEEAKRIWLEEPRVTHVYTEEGKVLGSYYLKTNHAGPGDHVCNCGFMVSSEARGKGIATLMCEHSQQVARELGYKAMQFNFVSSRNEGAIRLWSSLGFETVGKLPKAFKHPKLGYIDALVMYKWISS